MKIYLMRHCLADEGPRMDALRELTKQGNMDAANMSKFTDFLGVEFDLIITSDFTRGLQTAAYWPKDIERVQTKDLRPDGTPEKAWTSINKLIAKYIEANAYDEEEDGKLHVLVIGHGPLIHQILAAVSFVFEPAEKVFSHGSMVKLQTQTDHRFHWLVTPQFAAKILDKAGEDVEESLIESLDVPHKRSATDPLIRKMARAVRQRLRTAAAPFPQKFTAIAKAARIEGAAQAMKDLGPISEAERKKPISPELAAALAAMGDPERTWEQAIADIDWTRDDASAERAELIAEYEVSKAYHDGMTAYAQAWRFSRGKPTEKHWDIQPDACEVCTANEAYGWIPEEAPFDSGDFQPPAHPRCRCSLSYRAMRDFPVTV